MYCYLNIGIFFIAPCKVIALSKVIAHCKVIAFNSLWLILNGLDREFYFDLRQADWDKRGGGVTL